MTHEAWVLLIEDSPTFLARLAADLREGGYRVLTASTGEEGLRLAETARPAAIIVDAVLPGIDGATVIHRLKLDPDLRDVPCLLITASPGPSSELEAFEAGADAFVAKEGDLRMLRARLTALLRGAPTLHSHAASPARRPRVLVVDDSPTHLLRTAAELEEDGLEVLTARSGESALEVLARGGIDCILLDLMMPGLGGREVCQRINRDPALQDIPLILVSSSDDRAELISALDAGADDFVAKSSDFAVLRSRVRALLRRKREADERRAGAERRLRDELEAKAIRELAAARERLIRELEQKHRASEERFRTLVESMEDMVFTVDRYGRYDGFFGQWSRRHGLDAAHVLGNSPAEAFGPEAGAAHQAAFERALAGERLVYEWSWAGEQHQVRLSPRFGAGGEVVGLVGVGREVTEQKRLQTQLVAADRMACVGMLSAGVAHEINNPLASLLANLDLALADAGALPPGALPPGAGELLEELRDAWDAAQRIRGLVQDIKVFARAPEETLGPVDVHRAIESSCRMVRGEVRHRARLVLALEPVPLVEANEARVGQVVLNLVLNAVHAILEGKAGDNEIRVESELAADGRVVIAVRDTGCGMTAEVMARLFQPFFTTKPPGVGTGLGLSICQRIVAGMGGEITAQSEVGRGSVFRVFLRPAREAQLGAVADHGAPARASVPRGRVLVVDDDPLMTNVALRALAPQHEVAVENEGVRALERIAAGERYDVILCDLMMPRMSGMEVYQRLRAEDPAQAERVVFVTAGAFTPAARAFLDELANVRLDKPFDAADLRKVVDERLAVSRGSIPAGSSG